MTRQEAIDKVCTVFDAEDAIAPVIRELEAVGFSKEALSQILAAYSRDLADGLEIL